MQKNIFYTCLLTTIVWILVGAIITVLCSCTKYQSSRAKEFTVSEDLNDVDRAALQQLINEVSND